MPKIVKLKQGSADWREWRKGGIGSSDAPVLMLESPWESVADLWRRKTGRLDPKATNAAMQHGLDCEQAAREALCAFTGEFFAPCCQEDSTHPFLRVSLDGWTGSLAAEIKSPVSEAKWMEMSTAVPDYYRAQLQFQLMVTETPRLYFWPFYEGRGNLLVIERDDPYIVELRRRAIQFWRAVEMDTYPPEKFFRERFAHGV